MAETSYASCGDLSLAYQVFGGGPVELVFAGSFVSHVELFWTMPEFRACGRASSPELGEDYTPSTEQIARGQEFGRAILSAWGSGAALKCLLSSVGSMRQLGNDWSV